MTRLATLLLAMSLAACLSEACYSRSPSSVTPELPSALCYRLRFDSWIPTYRARFGTAMVGLNAPLPDTLALLSTVATTSYGHPLYAVATMPPDSAHDSGFWMPHGHDSIDVRLPSGLGGGLAIRLPGTGDHQEGQAWTYYDESSDMLPPIAMTTVAADSVSCPKGI